MVLGGMGEGLLHGVGGGVVIHSEAEYQAALDEADALMDATPDTPDEARLSELADEIVAYEEGIMQEPKAVPDAWAAVQEALSRKAEINGQNRAWFEELLRALTALKQALAAQGLVEDDGEENK